MIDNIKRITNSLAFKRAMYILGGMIQIIATVIVAVIAIVIARKEWQHRYSR